MLVQRLPDPRDIAVPEDAEAAGEEPLLHAVTFDPLRREKPNERLGRRQPQRPDAKGVRTVVHTPFGRLALADRHPTS